MDDSFLIRKYCNEGDGDAAIELLKQYERPLYQYIWQMLQQQQDCEDVMQETFRKALRALPDYREENHFKSWLFRIGRNEAIDIIRRRRRTIVAEAPEEYLGGVQDIVSQPGARELIEERESVQALMRAIALLPEPDGSDAFNAKLYYAILDSLDAGSVVIPVGYTCKTHKLNAKV